MGPLTTRQLVEFFIACGLAIAFFSGFSWWINRRFARWLATSPDFDGKQEIARVRPRQWLYVAGFVLLWFIAHLAPSFAQPYGLTATTLLKALAFIALALSYGLVSRNEILATNLSNAVQRAQLLRKPFNLDGWLERRDRTVRRFRMLLPLAFGLLALMYVGMAIVFFYPIDRTVRWSTESQALDIVLNYNLLRPDVNRRITALTPLPDYLFPKEQEALDARMIRRYGADHVLLIPLKPDTTEARAKEMLAESHKLLADLRRSERWAIWVYYGRKLPKHPYPVVKDWYEPPTRFP